MGKSAGGRIDNGSHSGRKRIAVIGGGGASGLAALRVFLDRPELKGPDASWEIQAYDSRRSVGGVWLPEANGEIKKYPDEPPVPPTPLYESLTTNLPHPLMAYHDFPFPPETPLYPPASTVLKYLEDYAQNYGLHDYIHFNSDAQSVWWDETTSQWVIEVSNTMTGNPTNSTTDTAHRYDALIIANGHYGLPYTPTLPGINEWTSSGRQAMHSIRYREPSIFRGRVVLVVGGGPSGLDLVKDSTGIASQVINSTTTALRSNDPRVIFRPRLVELRPSGGVAVYSDGTTDSNIDIVVFATGYTLTFPFLRDLPHDVDAPSSPLPEALGCNGASLQPLARHTFPLRSYSPKTLAFMGLPSRLAPLPAVDVQAEAIATVFLPEDTFPPVWNQQLEEKLVSDRWAAMAQALGGDMELMADSWHKMFPGDHEIGDWDDYRDSLLELSGNRPDWAVNSWEREIYDAKVELRIEWEALKSEGVSEEWVKGIGKGGPQEWVPLMYRLLEHARKRSQGGAVHVPIIESEAI